MYHTTVFIYNRKNKNIINTNYNHVLKNPITKKNLQLLF